MPEGHPSSDGVTETYRCPSQVAWAVETCGITLIHRGTGTTRSLRYPEAALWDLLSRGYSYERTLSLLCAIASLAPEAAERLLLDSLAAWVEVGFLVREEDNHG